MADPIPRKSLEHSPLFGIRLDLSLFPPNYTLGPRSSATLYHLVQNISGDAHALKIKSNFIIAMGRATLTARRKAFYLSQVLKHKDLLIRSYTKVFWKVL